MIKLPRKKYALDYRIISWMAGIHILALLAFKFPLGIEGIAIVIGLYFLTGCIGITLGYHRLLSHRSFDAPRWVKRIVATCGSLAFQGSPMEWIATHRLHHSHADTEKDPHNSYFGFWFSHWGWIFEELPMREKDNLRKYARDIVADPYLMLLDKIQVQLALQASLGIALYLAGGWAWVVWGIFVRLVVVYHCTWFINSATHTWGYVRYRVDDRSKNIWWVALCTWGEGWHNNHHAHPNLATAGHRWWEFDTTYYVIWLMEKFGLAKNVRRLNAIPKL